MLKLTYTIHDSLGPIYFFRLPVDLVGGHLTSHQLFLQYFDAVGWVF